jgi:amino acid permease
MLIDCSGKVVLIVMLFCFTFITMVGGNPQHDKYGFRYWKTPGAFAEYVTTGSLGKFEGFLAALWKAAYVYSLHIKSHSYAVTDFLKFHYCRS